MEIHQNLTPNLTAANKNLDVLKAHFGHCFDKQGNFQMEKFQAELQAGEVNFSKESYGLDWLGRSYARLLASDAATTLLSEDEAFNRKPENANSQNLLLKGDNLEILKHLSNAYFERVKMIYIDPPYNTGGDGFVYQDDRKFTVKELQRLAGVSEEKAKRILEFTMSKSNSHSAWLTFMYPRLYVAKELLKADGVIFVSIDDNEVGQLRLLMDEVFGEENFVGQLPTVMNLKGNNDEYGFSGTHEYTVVYVKNKNESKLYEFDVEEEDLQEWDSDEIGLFKKGAILRATGDEDKREDRPEMFYPIFVKGGEAFTPTPEEFSSLYEKENKVFNDDFLAEVIKKYETEGYQTVMPYSGDQYGRWRWGYSPKNKEKFRTDIIVLNSSKGISIYKKQRPDLGALPSKKPKSLLYKPTYSSGNGTAQLKSLLGSKFFSNPKPIDLIMDLIQVGTCGMEHSIILDFFAGSGTTGDAVMQINAQDGGNRQFILAQLPEKIDPNNSKAAYDFVKSELGIEEPTIFEITKERLIRAANKLREERPEEVAGKDMGFKVFETIPLWEDYHHKAVTLEEDTPAPFRGDLLGVDDLQALFITWKTYDGSLLTEDAVDYDLGGYVGKYVNQRLYLMQKNFTTDHLVTLLERVETDADFNPRSVIVFESNFQSKNLRELSESLKNFQNQKSLEIDFIMRF
jgi:adenine-specific DNA-methyltransferase